jgi:hypothetical protein
MRERERERERRERKRERKSERERDRERERITDSKMTLMIQRRFLKKHPRHFSVRSNLQID